VTDQLVTLIRQSFAVRNSARLRRLVAWAARRVGLDREREQDLALAVTEAASNAIRHGGGHGRLDLIQDDSRALIAEISDEGPGMAPDSPVALPAADQGDGRGLYLIRQTCDRVEVHTGPHGTTVHLEIDLHPAHDHA
jgi:anti-sigma regulatory factor (Ser/Thr protein kinase)